MKNKYDKEFWKFEQQHKKKAKLINSELEKQYNLQKDNENFKGDYLVSICFNFHLYSSKLQKWVIETVLPCFTNETLISYYLIYLTDALMLKDKNKLTAVMTSIKAIGLVKDINLDNNKIILITNDNHVVKLKNLFNDYAIRKEYKNKCHSGCEFLIKNGSELNNGSYIVTIKDRYVGKKPIYHSVILTKEGYIMDPARNMIIKLDDYKKLLKPHVIMLMNREQMLNEIENLKATDEQFKESHLNNVLKLAINTQIKHN